MRRRVSGLFSVLQREINFIIKDKDLIVIILLSPIFYACFYGSAYFHKSEQDVPVAVVDMDKSSLSQQLIRNLDAHQLININEVLPDLNSAIDRVNSFKSHGIVFIPKNFENNLKSGKGTDLKVYLNTTRFLISNDINKAVNEVTGTISAGVRLKYFQTQGYSFEQAKELIEPLNCEVKSLFNPVEGYGDFLIPGLLVLILQQTLLIGLAESVAKEREFNTLHELYATSNKSIWATITGKGLFYFILFSSYAVLFYTLHFSIFKISFRGSVSAVVLLTALFLISVIYMGIFVSSFFKRKIVSLQLFAFTSYPFFLISGYPWPRQTMPLPIRYLSYVIPSTPYLNAFNRITQMGAGWIDILPELYQLVILCCLGLVLAKIRMKILVNKEDAKRKKEDGFGVENLETSGV
ncbi:MAG: ABC transporter permease [Bacteroidota bacterium]|nr:ABC transporter permease [Bacteroidota bacterium]MDP4190933.1 ABC transporter permease [Bacteroidota bacterium]MDP4193961.1 ABC transporter permease [Bacteroidota bacterium]